MAGKMTPSEGLPGKEKKRLENRFKERFIARDKNTLLDKNEKGQILMLRGMLWAVPKTYYIVYKAGKIGEIAVMQPIGFQLKEKYKKKIEELKKKGMKGKEIAGELKKMVLTGLSILYTVSFYGLTASNNGKNPTETMNTVNLETLLQQPF